MPTLAAKPDLDQTRTPPAVIAAIVAISIVASLFIFWLVYIHPPVDAAGSSFNFLPALNAFLNAASALALYAGYRFIRVRLIQQHRNAMFTAFVFSSAFLVCYLATYFLHGETRLPIAHTGLLWYSYAIILFAHAHSFGNPRAADDPDHIFPVADRPLPCSSAARALDVSHLAVRVGERRVRLLHPGDRAALMQNDTRKLLATGSGIFLTGAISALLMLFVFGGVVRRQGPHTTAGWLALMIAMGCLPTGTLTLLLAITKLAGERTRASREELR